MIKSIITTFATRSFCIVLSFLSLLLTTRYLGSEGRGLISLLITSAGLIGLFSGLIGGSSLVFLIPRNKNKTFLKQILQISLIWSLLSSISVVCVLYFFDLVPQKLVLHCIVIGFALSINNTLNTMMLAFEKILFYNINSILLIFLNVLVFIVLIFFLKNASVDYYLISLYFSYFIVLAISFYLIHVIIPKNKHAISIKDSFAQLAKYGSVSQFGNIIQYLNYRLSFYILNQFNGLASVGVYSVGVVISETLWMFSSSISLVQYSKVANTIDTKYSQHLTLKLAKLSFFITLLPIVILNIIPSSVFSIIFGKDFHNLKDVFLYLSPGVAIFGYSIIVSHYFAGLGKYIVNTKAAFLGLIVTLIFNFLLVPRFGVIGAAMTSSLSYLITGLYLILKFFRDTKAKFKDMFFTKDDFSFIINKISTIIKA